MTNRRKSPMHEVIENAKNRLVAIAEQMQAIQRDADASRRDLNDSEIKAIDTLASEFERLEADVARREKAETMASKALAGTGRVTDPGEPGTGRPVSRNGGRGRASGDEFNVGVPFAGRYAADLFGAAPRAVLNGTDFARAAIAGRGPGVPLISNAYGSEGIGSEGGYAVPPQFAWGLWDASLESEIVRPRSDVRPMASNSLSIGGFDTLDHSAGSLGGFVGAWSKEGGTFTAQKPKLRSVLLTTKKLGIFGQLTNEVIFDSPTLWRDLSPLMASAIGWNLDQKFLNGTGAGEPLGVLKDPALVTVSKESGQAANTIVAANITKMYARLHPSCLRGATWVVNSTAIPQLLGVSITSTFGTDGLAVVRGPLLQEVAPGRFSMLGIPVIPTEQTPVLSSKGDIILADFGQYVVGMRSEILMAASNAPGWTTDMTDFRCIVRVDGLGKWSAPITPKNGDTQSWCVTLEAR